MSHTAEHAKAEPAVGNAMFLHNMRALWRCDPVLALLVDAVHDDERLPLEPTRSGVWTVKMETSAGSVRETPFPEIWRDAPLFQAFLQKTDLLANLFHNGFVAVFLPGQLCQGTQILHLLLETLPFLEPPLVLGQGSAQLARALPIGPDIRLAHLVLQIGSRLLPLGGVKDTPLVR